MHVADSFPASVSQLTALRQLALKVAPLTALQGLHVLSGLTQLCVQDLSLSPGSPELQLSGLQHLELHAREGTFMPMDFLARCYQLRVLTLEGYVLLGPDNLLPSEKLQDLLLSSCHLCPALPGAPLRSWQQALAGPWIWSRLPHLTSLQLVDLQPPLQPSDIECVLASCSNLQMLDLPSIENSFAGSLARLTGLISLRLDAADDEQCGMLAQLTGLRELRVVETRKASITRLVTIALNRAVPRKMSTAGVQQLAALKQLPTLGLGSCLDQQTGHLKLPPQLQISDRLESCRTFTNKVGCASAEVPTLSLWMKVAQGCERKSYSLAAYGVKKPCGCVCCKLPSSLGHMHHET